MIVPGRRWLFQSVSAVCCCAVALALALTVAGSRAAHAQVTLTVTGQSDGPGTCDAHGSCTTLRAAVTLANAAVGGGDAIVVPAGTYVLGSTLPVTRSMVIEGAGVNHTFVDGGHAVRVFSVGPAAVVVMSALTVQNGVIHTDGAGIDNDGTLTLNDVAVVHNAAALPGEFGRFGGRGGGLSNSGTLTVNRGTVSDNEATEGGGIVAFPAHGAHLGPVVVNGTTISRNQGSGIATYGPLTLKQVVLDHNGTRRPEGPEVSLFGGGLQVKSTAVEGSTFTGSAVVDSSTISNNENGLLGGGIEIDAGSVSITNTTISGNIAHSLQPSLQGEGGGIFQFNGTLTMTNVTLAGNIANESGSGGAIQLGFFLTPGGNPIAKLSFVTISTNKAAIGAGINVSAGTLTMRDTIIAGNSTKNCVGGARVTSGGYNLEDAHDCGLTTVGDQSGANPQLGPLATNGGPTLTMALPATSPAVDAADPACDVATDQRGVARPQGPRCDIGAYELVGGGLPRPPVTGAKPSGGTGLGGTLILLALLGVVGAGLAVRPRRLRRGRSGSGTGG